jgi:integrase
MVAVGYHLGQSATRIRFFARLWPTPSGLDTWRRTRHSLLILRRPGGEGAAVSYVEPRCPPQVPSVSSRRSLYAAFYLAAASGMRRGELLGLRWCDLDLESRQLSVVQCVIEVAHAVRIGPPKSDHSRRMIALDQKTVAVLAEHKMRQQGKRLQRGASLAPDDLVFAQDDGSPIHPGCFSQIFGRRVATARVPRIRFHDLRHTHATLALRAHVHPKIVSERLGHSTIAITLDIYSHCIPSMQREAADAIGALLP